MAEASTHRPPKDHLPVREPQARLNDLPVAPTDPLPVNLVGVPADEAVDRRFNLTRLRRIRTADDDPVESTS